jgi:threonine dehydratase
VEDDNSLVPAMIAVFLGIGGAIAGVAVVLVTVLVLA